MTEWVIRVPALCKHGDYWSCCYSVFVAEMDLMVPAHYIFYKL